MLFFGRMAKCSMYGRTNVCRIVWSMASTLVMFDKWNSTGLLLQRRSPWLWLLLIAVIVATAAADDSSSLSNTTAATTTPVAASGSIVITSHE